MDDELTAIQVQARSWLDARTQSIVGNVGEQDILERLRDLSMIQLRYIAVRQDVQFDRQAAEIIGISPDVVGCWHNKREINDILQCMALSKVVIARAILKQKTADAALVISGLLDGDIMDGIGGSRLKAAREILNRSGIIAPTRSESVRLSKHIIETRNPREYSEDQLHAIIDGEVVRTIGPGDDDA